MRLKVKVAQVVLFSMNIIQKKEYNTLEFYSQFYSEIPSKEGVYYWVFWPFKDSYFEDVNFERLQEKIHYFCKVNLNIPENINTGYKFRVEISERGFDNDVFGLGYKKSEILMQYLKTSKKNRIIFFEYLKNISFNKPFYIGKADNLRTRLRQHIDQRNSNILEYLIEMNIQFSDVLIGYEIIDTNFNESMNLIFEEVSQRITKPGLTKRPG
jgi:hypothetical protein